MSEKNEPIRLVAYDPKWPQLFLEEKQALGRVLNPWLRGPIEHIGSTAVPGLAAKPVIDVMAGIGTLEDARDAIAAVGNLEYLYAPYRSDEMHWFCKPTPSHRTHHLHLIPYQSDLWKAQLAFRDCLRADRTVAADYTELKRRLGRDFEHDREGYTEGKREFIARIVREALAECGPSSA